MNGIEGEIKRAGLTGKDAEEYRRLDNLIRLAERQKRVAPLSVAVDLCAKMLDYREQQQGLIKLQSLLVK